MAIESALVSVGHGISLPIEDHSWYLFNWQTLAREGGRALGNLSLKKGAFRPTSYFHKYRTRNRFLPNILARNHFRWKLNHALMRMSMFVIGWGCMATRKPTSLQPSVTPILSFFLTLFLQVLRGTWVWCWPKKSSIVAPLTITLVDFMQHPSPEVFWANNASRKR